MFKALDHQMRRDILRYIGEEKQSTFTAIMNTLKVDSPTLSYHLRTLSPFIEQKDSKYSLTPLGKDAYGLLSKTSSTVTSTILIASLKKEISCVMITNAILWECALVSVALFEGGVRTLTISIFAVLWFISSVILNSFATQISS